MIKKTKICNWSKMTILGVTRQLGPDNLVTRLSWLGSLDCLDWLDWLDQLDGQDWLHFEKFTKLGICFLT